MGFSLIQQCLRLWKRDGGVPPGPGGPPGLSRREGLSGRHIHCFGCRVWRSEVLPEPVVLTLADESRAALADSLLEGLDIGIDADADDARRIEIPGRSERYCIGTWTRFRHWP